MVTTPKEEQFPVAYVDLNGCTPVNNKGAETKYELSFNPLLVEKENPQSAKALYTILEKFGSPSDEAEDSSPKLGF